jgi:hypothetical protein
VIAGFDCDGSVVVRAAIASDQLSAMRTVFEDLVPDRNARHRRGGALREVTGAAISFRMA